MPFPMHGDNFQVVGTMRPGVWATMMDMLRVVPCHVCGKLFRVSNVAKAIVCRNCACELALEEAP